MIKSKEIRRRSLLRYPRKFPDCLSEVPVGLPAIRFSHIRPLDGSQHTAFEEVCCQLAALQPSPKDSEFLRKGRGADGGVECLWRRADGSEHGWQAKYVFQWDDSLTSQLNDSIETALEAHPKLTEYTVCLPFDLSDGRVVRGKSARRKWEDWKKKWIDQARSESRPLVIRLWGQSELTAQLTSDPDRMAGRILYWFEEYAFSPDFFKASFDAARAALGSRYTPETNITLPIRHDLLSLSRDGSLQEEIDHWLVRICDAATAADTEFQHLGLQDDAGHLTNLRRISKAVVDALSITPVDSGTAFPIVEWLDAVRACAKAAYAAHRWLYTVQFAHRRGTQSGADPRAGVITHLRDLLGFLQDAEEALAGRRWQLANKRGVLITGHAGTGKSHLLADVVQHQVRQGFPALLIPSSQLNDSEPWRQILEELHRPATEEVRHFLGALDALAESQQTRALVCVDALNERHGIRFWYHRLAAFLAAAQAFPRIVIVVSCRTTYVPYVVPSSLIGEMLYSIEHEGFGQDHSGQAAQRYLEERGVTRPGAPSLLPEFNNPLFLKTCCDLLERQGVREFPRGMRGVSSIFKFYFDAITESINRRLHLDPHYGVVPNAIQSFVDALAERGDGYLEKREAIALFEKLRPSAGTLDDSLLSQLSSEGLLSIEPVADAAGKLVEHVRFTFERYSDYAVAQRALDRWLDVLDMPASLAQGSPLGEILFGKLNYERAGVIEAVSVLLPERTGAELLDFAPENDWTTIDAFRHSLLWREQRFFSERTYELVKENWDDDVVDDLLISVSTEPANRYNARFIDSSLRKLAMPERDATWSTYLARRGFDGEIETLISWALSSGHLDIDPDRVDLAATILTWFLTTSHRAVRDRATKALVALFANRLDLAASLLLRFRDVDDPYVVERLLAACYGAALQGNDAGLVGLAETVHRLVFARSPVLVDILARDHALSIMEYAASRDAIPPHVELDACRPPYSSEWPIEAVPDELIETYREAGANGSYHDDIVSSTINDGDFARYKMDRRVDDWSPALIHTSLLPTIHDIYSEWESAFLSGATVEQRAALEGLRNAAEALEGKGRYEDSPEMDAWRSARESFRGAVASSEWERFRVSAESYIRFNLNNEWSQQRPATFDTHWARRWVCKRAHDLGWRSDLFSEFERAHIAYGRSEHKIERIGKKYQWIAFRELLARMADNLAYIGSFPGRDERKPGVYKSARQIDVRDIDPSLLVSTTFYDDWAQWNRTWWSPVQPRLRAMSLRDRLAWLDSSQDVLSGPNLIDVVEPHTGRRWLVLSAFARWWGGGLNEGRREVQRSTWYRLRCVVVSKKEFATLQKAMSGQTMVDIDSFDRLQFSSDYYLGEYSWHRDLADEGRWSNRGPRHHGPKTAKPATAEYRCEAGAYDHSLDKTVGIEVPAPWLSKALDLRMLSGRRPEFVDRSGTVLFFDPSASEPGPSAALVDRDVFLAMLQREDLRALWVIAGEKDVSSGGTYRQELVGRYSHTRSFWLEGDWHCSKLYEEWFRMNAQKLAEALGEFGLAEGGD